MKSYIFFFILFVSLFLLYRYYNTFIYYVPVEPFFKYIFIILGICALIFPTFATNAHKLSNKKNIEKFIKKKYKKK